jgi:hypothetical protein
MQSVNNKGYICPPPKLSAVKILFLLLIALSLTISSTSCKQEVDEGNTDPKTLVITGTEGTKIDTKLYKYAWLYQTESSTAPVAGSRAVGGMGTYTFPLYKVVVNNDGTWSVTGKDSNRWTGNGSYYIRLVVSNYTTSNTSDDRSDRNVKVNFDTATVTVAYNTTDWVTVQ